MPCGLWNVPCACKSTCNLVSVAHMAFLTKQVSVAGFCLPRKHPVQITGVGMCLALHFVDMILDCLVNCQGFGVLGCIFEFIIDTIPSPKNLVVLMEREASE